VCLAAAAAALVLSSGEGLQRKLGGASRAATLKPTGSPQLVAIEPLPSMDGQMCQWVPASASTLLSAELQEAPVHRSADWDTKPPGNADRAPTRIIRDTYPTYSAIALNLQTNEVFLQDENLFGIKVFDRLTNTPPTAAFSEPKRAIAGGGVTKMEFNCGIYVDPRNGDIYSITNDTIDTMTVFPWNASGEVKPMRELYTPHGTFGISVDEDTQEIYLTVQHQNSVVVYPKNAQGEDKFLRELVGDKTQLEDPHGVAVDYKNQLMFVSNHGHGVNQAGDYGKFEPASITAYPLKASGDTAPLRIIEGARTRLNWPAALWVDQERGEFYVANDGDDSVLVFKTTDNGNVAPTRMIRGPKTHVSNPTGVFLDTKNDELWVSNMGNHSATVFARSANGDVAPKRIIRSAPLEKKALAIGNPGAVAYDSNRDEILVPN
jgi:DNA-binding beta-propeller fold protein YncE